MTISISISEDLAEQIKSLAERDHRSFSGQVAFFCAQGVRDPRIAEQPSQGDEVKPAKGKK